MNIHSASAFAEASWTSVDSVHSGSPENREAFHMMDHRSPKTVLVTGASAGIGRFVALDLAARGHRVFATGRNEKALASLREEAASQGASLDAFALDVTSAPSIAAAVAEIRAKTGGHGVDVIVNNAGYGQGGPLLELSDGTLREQFETNVFGLMAVTRAFVPEMIARGRGWIVNVSSVGGRVTFPFFGAYHASKYAVEALSDALRAELKSFGVHVAVVEPGPIQSQFSERAFGSLPAGQGASPYAASYALAGGIRSVADRTSFGPGHVAAAVRRAIGSRWPRARYVAPWFLAIPLALLPLVPTRLLDALFRRVFGLHRSQPPQLAGAAAVGS
jgi:short-subunit dehydrogenase